MPRTDLHRPRHRLGWQIAVIALGLVAAACEPGAPRVSTVVPGTSTAPSPETADPGQTAVSIDGSSTPLPAITARPLTPVPDGTGEPPAAMLSGLDSPADPVAGALGSYSWDDEASDAPWIVPSATGSTGPGSPLAVSFDPALEPPRWVARWATIRDGAAGDVASAAEGTGAVAFAAPAGAGSWSVQLDARFGTGRNAVWFWRIEVP